MYTIRRLLESDYNRGYLDLLDQLADVGEVTNADFVRQFWQVKSDIFVIENKGKIVASGTLLYEDKFIHGLSSAGHIEDIVVDADYRKAGIGSKMLQHLIGEAQRLGCYKVVLNCDPGLKEFYQRFDFSTKNIEMSRYF